MISTPSEAIKERAKTWQSSLEAPALVEPNRSAIGGGSLPGETLPSWVLALSAEDIAGGPEEVMRRLRQGSPPIIARIEDDRVLLDPRTVLPEEEEGLLRGLKAALGG